MTSTQVSTLDSSVSTSYPHSYPSTSKIADVPGNSPTSMMPWDDDGDDDTLLDLSPPDHKDRLRLDHILSLVSLAFDVSWLYGLDDDVLVSPVDAFADLCYAQCTTTCDGDECAKDSTALRGLRSDSGHGSDTASDSDSEITTPTEVDLSTALRWRRSAFAFAKCAEERRRVTFAPLPLSQSMLTKSEAILAGPAFCDPEMAFLLSSPASDPNDSVHFFPTWPEERRAEGGTLKTAVMRGLAGLRLRSGLSR